MHSSVSLANLRVAVNQVRSFTLQICILRVLASDITEEYFGKWAQWMSPFYIGAYQFDAAN